MAVKKKSVEKTNDSGAASISRSLPTRRSAAEGVVRIVGGEFRKTPLSVLSRDGLRPSPERVRITVFDWLRHLKGGLSGLRFFDMFAGTGAMGFEAASCGAEHVTAIELDRRTAAKIRETVNRLGISERFDVVCGDAFAYLSNDSSLYDVVFVDPPFSQKLEMKALESLRSRLATGAIVYVERDHAFDEKELEMSGWRVLRASKAGAVHFILVTLAL